MLYTCNFTCLEQLISASIRVITISDTSLNSSEIWAWSHCLWQENYKCAGGLSGKGTHVWCLTLGLSSTFVDVSQRWWVACCDMRSQVMTLGFQLVMRWLLLKKEIFFPEGVKGNQNLILCSFSHALWLYLTNFLLTRRAYPNPFVKVKDTPLSVLNYILDDVP